MAVGAVILSLSTAVMLAIYLSSTVGVGLLGIIMLYAAFGTLALTMIFGVGWISIRRAN